MTAGPGDGLHSAGVTGGFLSAPSPAFTAGSCWVEGATDAAFSTRFVDMQRVFRCQRTGRPRIYASQPSSGDPGRARRLCGRIEMSRGTRGI